jgi:hypothetical protein
MLFTIVSDEAAPSPVVGDPSWCIFVASTQPLAIELVEATRSAPLVGLWQFFGDTSIFHVTLSDSGFPAWTAGGVFVGAPSDAAELSVAGGGELPPHAERRRAEDARRADTQRREWWNRMAREHTRRAAER